MSKNCYHCSKKFSLFGKKLSCAKCGLRFCEQCLSRSVQIPSRGFAKVCLTCYMVLTGEADAIQPDDIPINLGDPTKGLPSQLKNELSVNNQQSLRDQSNALSDDEIRKRLSELHGGKKLPTDSEIRNRLQNLKDLPAEDTTAVIPSPINKTDDVQGLIAQMKDEEVLRHGKLQQHNEDKEFLAAVTKLNPHPLSVKDDAAALLRNSQCSKYDSASDEDSEKDADNVIKEAMDLNQLDEQLVNLEPVPKHKPGRPLHEIEMEQELPWCCICNADAAFRCLDCDDDLFCSRCFYEAHSYEDDMSKHRKKPYKRR